MAENASLRAQLATVTARELAASTAREEVPVRVRRARSSPKG
jgi:hypothetical protein